MIEKLCLGFIIFTLSSSDRRKRGCHNNISMNQENKNDSRNNEKCSFITISASEFSAITKRMDQMEGRIITLERENQRINTLEREIQALKTQLKL